MPDICNSELISQFKKIQVKQLSISLYVTFFMASSDLEETDNEQPAPQLQERLLLSEQAEMRLTSNHL